MKVYLDLIFLINFLFDFVLLMSVNNILRRYIKLKRLLLGSFIGSLSILFLFIPLNNITLFLFKTLTSIFMSIITFKYKDLKYTINNLYYLYTSSIILGGFLYLLNIEFSYKNVGLIFINKGLSMNYIVLVIISPIIIITYIKQIRRLKNNYSNYNKVKIILKDNTIMEFTGYIDSGNNLQYNGKMVIIVNNKKLNNIKEYFFIPYTTLNNNGLLKCIIPKKIYINEKKIRKKVIIGIDKNKINIDGVNCILNKNMIGEYYVK